MPDEPVLVPVLTCDGCGAQVPATLRACPSCHRLFHAERLKRLAQQAEQATRDGALSEALAAWREALELLPPGSRQHEAIEGRIVALARQVEGTPALSAGTNGPADTQPPKWAGGAGATGLGALALAAWKFKFVTLFLLSKGKLLLLGLTKASTFYSMLLTVGLYSSLWGWKFALGFVLSIYLHEMGHVVALLRYGIKASAPLFIPGLGAVVRLQQPFNDPRQDARVGLAGPVWGFGAALACFAIYAATGIHYWGALAKVGAMVNLFNLMPIWQLDGGRAFHSMTRPHRWLAATVVATAWAVTSNGLIFILMLVAGSQAAFGKPAREPDTFATLLYAFLFASLAALMTLPVPIS